MNKQAAINLVKDTFEHPYDRDRFVTLSKNILHSFEPATFVYRGNYIPDAYKKHIKTLERIGKYEDQEGNKIDILAVSLVKESTLGRARTLQRNFISWYLNGSRGDVSKDAALVAFYVEEAGDWRLSLVKMDYRLDKTDTGKLKTVTELTPARRLSFLVGEQENSHTAQRQILPLLQREETPPTLTDLENTFSVEVVTKEFFEKYKQLFLTTKEALDKAIAKDEKIKQDFEEKHIDSVDFTKKLLGQIVFLYFLQKKGWFGVSRDDTWGSGPKDFLRLLFEQQIASYDNFFNDILEPLFYEALAIERSGDFYSRFNCKIPFLNGGLFDPLHNYDWIHTDIHLPNDLFSNQVRTKEGDVGNGILDVFDRYNFTVKEDEPLEKEVAVDPEMLGKVFENLLEVKDRKSKGTYYTPREIVHYMCQESLVNYLVTKLQGSVDEDDIRTLVRIGETAVEHDTRVVETGVETDTYSFQLPENVRSYAKQIDEALKEIKVCDPAVGSGAFLVGMMSEIIRLRNTLTSYLENGDRSIYGFKHHAIQNSLYGVDIDPGAIEIAKLRLWLSLIVDEQDIRQIKPLPNLDYKIMQGNSLLEEFEGIKLFDEELLTQPKFDNSAQVKDIKERINELQRQFFELHAKREFHGAKRQEIETELGKLNRTLKRLTKEPKPKAENASLFDQVSEAKQKADQLKKLHTEFFDTAHKNEKDRIKKQIEQLTWELIEATLREQNKSSLVKQIEKFRQSNVKPFFLWKLNFSEVFENGNGGFDVVIANPPYVRQEGIEYKESLEREYQIYNSVSDLYTYFYERGLGLLKLRGVLSFITSNKFLRARYGIYLRRLLRENAVIRNIINFNDKHIFEAITNTLILVALNDREKDNELNYSDNIDNPGKIKFHQQDLSDREWTIDEPEIIDLKKKIESLGDEIKDWDVRINYGLKTGYNEAFVVNEETKERLINEDDNASILLKPIIRGRDIGRYCYKKSGLYLIITHNGYDKPDGERVDAIDVNNFPSVKNHLEKYRQKLTDRKDQGETIYNLRNCAFMEDFSKEKIIWIELTNKSKFAYSDKEDYLLAGAFLMVGESLKYLLAFLNSKLCYFYFSLICNSSGMATIQWKKFAMEKIPVMRIGEDKQTPFIRLVDKILEVTSNDSYQRDSSMQSQVARYEQEIDQLFYQLYDLGSEEIEIIESYGHSK